MVLVDVGWGLIDVLILWWLYTRLDSGRISFREDVNKAVVSGIVYISEEDYLINIMWS